MRRATRFRAAPLGLLAGLLSAAAVGGTVDATPPDSPQPQSGDCARSTQVFGAADRPVEPCRRPDIPTGSSTDSQFIDNTIRDLGKQPTAGKLEPGAATGTPQPAPPASGR